MSQDTRLGTAGTDISEKSCGEPRGRLGATDQGPGEIRGQRQRERRRGQKSRSSERLHRLTPRVPL